MLLLLPLSDSGLEDKLDLSSALESSVVIVPELLVEEELPATWFLGADFCVQGIKRGYRIGTNKSAGCTTNADARECVEMDIELVFFSTILPPLM